MDLFESLNGLLPYVTVRMMACLFDATICAPTNNQIHPAAVAQCQLVPFVIINGKIMILSTISHQNPQELAEQFV
jgi:hypothetical protein